MARVFKTPFAAQGDKDAIPTPTQGDGSVSVTQGFGFDYQREYEDPLAKDIRREDMNGILHDITEAVGDIQLTGVAKWSAEAAPYPTGAVVWHNGTAWLSLAENNEVEPVAGANWAAQRPATLFVEKSANLSDLANVATARTNLGLGNSATLNVGTAANTVAAGNDSRITGASQKSANLSDLTNASTARANIGLGNNATGRANLGLGDSATLNVGTASGTVAAGNDTRITNALQRSNNLSELGNFATARSNLGLGTSATRDATTSTTDATLGRTLKVGDYGLGTVARINTPTNGGRVPSGFYYYTVTGAGLYGGGSFFMQLGYAPSLGTPGFRISNRPYTNDFYFHGAVSGSSEALRSGVLAWHEGNFNPNSKVNTGNLAVWSGSEWSLSVNDTTAGRVPSGYAMTGIYRPGSSLTIYARRFSV